jgi:hypothetical protein
MTPRPEAKTQPTAGMTLFDSLYRSFEQSDRSTGTKTDGPAEEPRNGGTHAEATQERAVRAA